MIECTLNPCQALETVDQIPARLLEYASLVLEFWYVHEKNLNMVVLDCLRVCRVEGEVMKFAWVLDSSQGLWASRSLFCN